METVRRFKRKIKKAITVVEILVAVFILALAALPAIGTFSTYYSTATKQMEQETALKIAEAVINLMRSISYELIIDKTVGSVPLEIQTTGGTVSCNLVFSDSNNEVVYGEGIVTPVYYTAKCENIQINRVKYNINVDIIEVFKKQNLDTPHTEALSFIYYDDFKSGSTSEPIKKYDSFDPAFIFNVSVGFVKTKPIKLSSFRADMVK